MMNFEVRKPHLDLLALIARLLKLWCADECAGMVAGFFVDVACNLSEWSTCALFLEFANAALAGLGQVVSNAAVVNCSRGPQKPVVRTDLDVALRVVNEVESGEHAVSAFVSLPHRNMRRNILLPKPGQQPADPIGRVTGKPVGL